MAIATETTTTRVLNSNLSSKIMSAAEAAALIRYGDHIGMSGFTGSGYPKDLPIALAHRIDEAHFRGHKFRVGVFTGASTGPELDGALAMAAGIHLRLPYQSDPETRKRINDGDMEYMDIHLSHVAQFIEYGFLGKLDMALIEVTAISRMAAPFRPSLGNNRTWIDEADRIILEVNSWQPIGARRHARYLLPRAPPTASPFHSSRRPAHRLALPQRSAREGCRRDRHPFARPQYRVQRAR